VFAAAPPIVGGREVRWDGKELEEGARPDQINNFQGRYIIRHPWTGPIQCENPQRGVWGGPPGGGQPPTRAAQDTAFAPRGKVELASFVTTPVAELDLKAAALSPVEDTEPRPPGPFAGPTDGGCASCALATTAPPRGLLALLVCGLGTLLYWRRRR
jgi:hypothetical protein